MQGLNSRAVVWSHSGSPLPLVLLLHGFGSNERDLASLVAALPPTYQYVALRGPLEVQSGYSWFPLTMHGAQLAATGGRVAARAVARWAADQQVSPVGAIGFSQGGALALELLREAELPDLHWVGVLAGFILAPDAEGDGTDERDALLAERRPQVFWGRGDADTMISPELVAQMQRWLPEHCEARVELYSGLTHSVSATEIADLSDWMLERGTK